MMNQRLNAMINGNGLLDDFYTLLWFKSQEEHDQFFNFNLPHTLIFKDGKPSGWYFSNKYGHIVKKSNRNITKERIENAFKNNISKSGIIAHFYYKQQDKEDQLSIKYITTEDFDEFLNENNDIIGVLQQFVDPETINNQMIECIWSPNICIYEKRVNIKNLYDLRYDLFERASTFDGQHFFIEIEKLKSPNIVRQIKEAMIQISEHLKKVSYGSFVITRMKVYFKVDKDQKIWLLMCNSIRSTLEAQLTKSINKQKYEKFFEEQKYNNSPLTINIPETEKHDKKNIYSVTSKAVEIVKTRKCFRCSELICKIDMIDCPNEFFILEYDQKEPDERTKNIIKKESKKEIQMAEYSSGTPYEYQVFSHKIPQDINKLFPNMKQEQYEAISKNVQFLGDTVQVCVQCYIQLSQTKNALSGYEKVKKYNVFTQENQFQDKNVRDTFQNPTQRTINARLHKKLSLDLKNVLYKSLNMKSSSEQIEKNLNLEKQQSEFYQKMKKSFLDSKKGEYQRNMQNNEYFIDKKHFNKNKSQLRQSSSVRSLLLTNRNKQSKINDILLQEYREGSQKSQIIQNKSNIRLLKTPQSNITNKFDIQENKSTNIKDSIDSSRKMFSPDNQYTNKKGSLHKRYNSEQDIHRLSTPNLLTTQNYSYQQLYGKQNQRHAMTKSSQSSLRNLYYSKQNQQQIRSDNNSIRNANSQQNSLKINSLSTTEENTIFYKENLQMNNPKSLKQLYYQQIKQINKNKD